MTVQEYWREIRRTAATFDPEAATADLAEFDALDRTHLKKSERGVRLISLDNPEKGSRGGQCCEMKPYAAAERIYAGTHRLATDSEWDAYQAEMAQARDRNMREEQARVSKGTQVNVDPKALAAAIAGIMPKEAA